MIRPYRRIVWLVVLALVLSGLSWWGLPEIIGAMPAQYRQRLPQRLLQWVTTPMPTALPAPVVAAVVPRITVPVLDGVKLQVTPAAATRTPEFTATATSQPGGQGSATTIPATWTAAPSSTRPLSPTPTATSTPTPTQTRMPLPADFRLSGLENVPQKFNNCGPANLSLNLSFYRHPVPQLDIAAVLKPNEADRNVSPDEMATYVNQNTSLRAMHLSGGDLELLKRLIVAGFPVIIEKGLKPSEWEGWMGHYLTLFGYDDTVEAFYSMDTYLGPWDGSGRADSYAELDRQWSHFNRTFLLIYRPAQQELMEQILGPIMREPAAMWQQAAVRAQEETERSPDNPFAWFNLGTNLTHLARILNQAELYSDAAAAFDRARHLGLPARMLWYQFQPYEAYLSAGRPEEVLLLTEATLAYPGGRDVEETYLYRGHALLATGDMAGARAAYQQALRVNPRFALAQAALNSLK